MLASSVSQHKWCFTVDELEEGMVCPICHESKLIVDGLNTLPTSVAPIVTGEGDFTTAAVSESSGMCQEQNDAHVAHQPPQQEQQQQGTDATTHESCPADDGQIQQQDDDDEKDAASGEEEALVLPCGHLMGKNCYLEWHDACMLPGRAFTCPICRFDLQPRRCPRHPIHPAMNLGRPDPDQNGEYISGLEHLLDIMEHAPPGDVFGDAARECADCKNGTYSQPFDSQPFEPQPEPEAPRLPLRTDNDGTVYLAIGDGNSVAYSEGQLYLVLEALREPSLG